MTAEEILIKYRIDPGYAKYTPEQGYKILEEILKEFAKIKCAEQRKLCFQSSLILRTCAWDAPDRLDCFEDGEFTYHIDSDSILNAKEPEI